MSPPVSTTTVGSWPSRADGAMNPPSVVTSSRRLAAAGVFSGASEGDGAIGFAVGAPGLASALGSAVGALVGDRLGAGLAIGGPLPQANATRDSVRTLANRRFMADPLGDRDVHGRPVRAD